MFDISTKLAFEKSHIPFEVAKKLLKVQFKKELKSISSNKNFERTLKLLYNYLNSFLLDCRFQKLLNAS